MDDFTIQQPLFNLGFARRLTVLQVANILVTNWRVGKLFRHYIFWRLSYDFRLANGDFRKRFYQDSWLTEVCLNYVMVVIKNKINYFWNLKCQISVVHNKREIQVFINSKWHSVSLFWLNWYTWNLFFLNLNKINKVNLILITSVSGTRY